MKKYIYTALAAALLPSLVSCDKDGDLLYTDGATKPDVTTQTSDIILSKDRLNALALTFYWTENGDITLDNPAVLPPANAVTNTVEMSDSETFANKVEQTIASGVFECRYTVMELNNITARLGMEGGVKAPLYVRVRSAAGVNIDPKYSDVLKLSVTPFFIDWTIGHYLDKDKNDTGVVLRSPEANGVYSGFVAAASWENWWFQDPVNSYWGNTDDGTPFRTSSDATCWNYWFPEPSGSYYVTVNTNEGWWSALHIDNISVDGDITGEMTFNKQLNQWTLPVNMASATTVSLTLSGKASLYNIESGTGAPASVNDIAFSGSSDALTFGSTVSAVSIALPAGEGSVVLDLSGEKPVLSAGDAAPVETVAERLYFSGLVEWTDFVDYLTLVNADTKTYGGAHYIKSEWGYRAYPEQAWNPAYKAGEGSDALSGTLVSADSDGNIPAPEEGLYAMMFSMGNLTYNLTKIENVSCTGLGDDWSLHAMTQDPVNPEVFTYEYVKEKETPWGVKVILNEDWNLFFGAGEKDGVAYLITDSGKSGFAGDNDIPVGATAVLTIDLGKQTFTYSTK